VRSRTRKLWRSIAEGASVGLLAGSVLGVGVALASGTPALIATIGGVGAVVVGLAASLMAALATPASHLDLVDPRSALRADPTAVMAALLVTAFAFELVSVLDYNPKLGVAFGMMALLPLILRSRWLEYTTARMWLALRGRLPWAPIRFLTDAHQRGVLRQIGAVYQLRHTRLQELLATRITM